MAEAVLAMTHSAGQIDRALTNTMDLNRLKIFHAAARAGSFTHAGETLNMSQSAVSRQVQALEEALEVMLFHRHARGLILTEPGEELFKTTTKVLSRLDATMNRLSDSRAKPKGPLRITTTIGFGTAWLTEHMHEFIKRYPDVEPTITLFDGEVNLAMREADVAIRFRQPTQGDLIQRKLFLVRAHAYASPAYIRQHALPARIEDLDNHAIIAYDVVGDSPLRSLNMLETAGREPGDPRRPILRTNNIYAVKKAVQKGMGISILPDYMIKPHTGIVRILPEMTLPTFQTYFVYPEELRNSARIEAFRDFLLSKRKAWDD